MSSDQLRPRLIAVDLDGTLMEDDHLSVSEQNRRALRAAAAQGVQVVLASGRPRCMMENVARTLDCVRWMITSNGAVIIDRNTGRALHCAEISPDRAAELLHLFSGFSLPLEVYCKGQVYVRRGSWSMGSYTKQPQEFLKMRQTLNREVEDLGEVLAGQRVEKFNVDGIDSVSLNAILSEIAKMSDLTHTYVPAYDNLEINECRATKGEALRTLCASLNISREMVMAFGDSSNDVPMLQWAKWSFAMGNAAPEARRAARFCTRTNALSGVASALETYLLA